MALTCALLKQTGEIETFQIATAKAAAAATFKLTSEMIMTKILKKKKGDPPQLIGTYPWKQKTLFLFGFDDGPAAQENQHQLPPPLEGAQFFGDIVVVASMSMASFEHPIPFTSSEYETFYTAVMEGEEEEEEEDAQEGGEVEETPVEDVEGVADEEEKEDDYDENDGGDEEGEGEADGDKGWDEDAEEEKPVLRAPVAVVNRTQSRKKAAPQPIDMYTQLSLGPELEMEKGVSDEASLPPIRRSVLRVLREQFNTKIDMPTLQKLEHLIYNTFLEQCDRRKMSRSWSAMGAKDVYLGMARTIIGNLNESSYIGNHSLYQAYTSGEFTLEQLVKRNAYELYPENWEVLIDQQAKREQIQLEGDRSRATDRFQCNRCGKREATYYELQTRSADEPMTIFINCLNCGKRWTQ